MSQGTRSSTSRWVWSIGVTAVLGMSISCGVGRPLAVSPSEIPDLEARVAAEPGNGTLLLRYAAALFAAERCDSASVVALQGQKLSPADPIAPLVLGQCLERSGRYSEAIRLYRGFAATNQGVAELAAVQARTVLATRSQATEDARQRLNRERELVSQPVDPRALAVLPVTVVGDSSHRSLSVGLAELITSDLALLQQFRLVERLELDALIEELDLAQTERVDQATAARVGRLVRAGRMVQGLVVISSNGNVRLDAMVVSASSEVEGSETVTGRFPDLIRLEKDLVIRLARRLGYQMSEAEEETILENGTERLGAFLAYSRGLVAERLGDYDLASVHFGQAARADAGFVQGRQRHVAAAATAVVARAAPGDVTTVARTAATAAVRAAGPETRPSLENAQLAAMADVASTQGERAAVSARDGEADRQLTDDATGGPATDVSPNASVLPMIIRFIFGFP